jgi:hypothetical protein
MYNIIFTEQFIIIYKSNKVYFLILFFLFSHIDLISSTLSFVYLVAEITSH